MGVRLLNRTTRSVAVTEVGGRVLDRLAGAMTEFEAALDLANDYRATPSGTLTRNVPVNVARLVLARILPAFFQAYVRLLNPNRRPYRTADG